MPLTASNAKVLPAKPLIPKPPITAGEILSVGPSDSSIVPLLEGPAIELNTFSTGSDINIAGEPPAVTDNPPPAVLNVNSSTKFSKPTQTHFSNPLFHHAKPVGEIGESSHSPHFFINAIVDNSASSIEEIPLQPLTSTPETVTRSATALKYFSRDVQQVEVADPFVLANPKEVYTYNNPAYEGLDFSNTLDFEPDEAAAIADPTFLDIIKLHRPAFTESKNRSIRINRLGLKQGTVQTRSGKIINKKVHFFKSISPVPEEIELHDFSTTPQTSTDSETNFFNNATLHTYTADTSNPYFSSTFSTGIDYTGQPFTILGSNTLLNYPSTNISTSSSYNFPTSIPFTPLSPSSPFPSLPSFATDYYLHPSLYLKHKYKLTFYPFFPDGIVAS